MNRSAAKKIELFSATRIAEDYDYHYEDGPEDYEDELEDPHVLLVLVEGV
jgi:hypothetical protein